MSPITTHILDTSLGRPACGVSVILRRRDGDRWTDLGAAASDSDGRVSGLLADDAPLTPGHYQLMFDTAAYFGARNTPCFYPRVEIGFTVAGAEQHYHVPLLLSPFGYSTYRGS